MDQREANHRISQIITKREPICDEELQELRSVVG
jgi:hypothetical protein